ncbi:MAG: type II toxin-antitoxin system RelE/ParE family toxin [Faecalibacterium sp.]
MSEKCYKLRILPLFEDDLNEIVDYIKWKLRNPIAAHHLVDAVELAIYKRLPCAESFQKYPSKKDRTHPYYHIIVKNFTVFYVVIDDVMEVRRILYSKRDFNAEVEYPVDAHSTKISETADMLIEENLEVLAELAK